MKNPPQPDDGPRHVSARNPNGTFLFLLRRINPVGSVATASVRDVIEMHRGQLEVR